jgi:hypothetical protein
MHAASLGSHSSMAFATPNEGPRLLLERSYLLIDDCTIPTIAGRDTGMRLTQLFFQLPATAQTALDRPNVL